MDYHVILIEYGKPTHHWNFQYFLQAFEQLKRLSEAFIEVNEVSATIVKASASKRDLSPYELLQMQVTPPDRSELG